MGAQQVSSPRHPSRPFLDRDPGDHQRPRADRSGAGGDADAFAASNERRIALIIALLARWTGSSELTAEVARETFAAALLGCRRFPPGGPPAVAWLLGIARNKLRESARRQRVDTRARERLGVPVLQLIDRLSDIGFRCATPFDGKRHSGLRGCLGAETLATATELLGARKIGQERRSPVVRFTRGRARVGQRG
jgi:hypothetical protein